MPDPRRRICTCCGRNDAIAGPISWEGNCIDCAETLLTENIEGMATMSGPAFRRWMRGMQRYIDRASLDERAGVA
jgi:hypothetical protein